ncbi:3-oxoacyl-[acyl-carrier-protein] synthase, KASII, partial [hydrothermal vent metagenome]
MSRRVVITGLGLITPLGATVASSWGNLIAGKSGAKQIQHFNTDDLACKIAAQVPWLDGKAGGGPDVVGSFDPDAVMSPRDRRRVDEFILYGIAAADQAIADSGWQAETEEDNYRAGVMIGSGIGGLETSYNASVTLHERGPRRIGPFVIPSMLVNLASGQVSIKHGLKGPNHSVVTACSTGAHAIGDASAIIARGDADMMVAGGAEASICRLGIACFIASRALTTGFNDTPERASRPYDKDRDGFL